MQASPENISSIVFIITCIFLLGGLFLLLYVRLYNKRKKRHADEKVNLVNEFKQQLVRSQVEVQEATYTALGRELHDNVGQLLGTAKMMLDIAELKADAAPANISTAKQTIAKAIHEIRSLAKILSTEWLQQFSFTENLASEAERINSAGLIKISFLNSSMHLPLNPEKQIILFRIVQEALQNAIKHSGASQISISLTMNGNHLDINISDNGRGFENKSAKPSGTGIANMQYRANLLGGSIAWAANYGKGINVAISLPIDSDYIN
jgi:signal transduction histidine kinase